MVIENIQTVWMLDSTYVSEHRVVLVVPEVQTRMRDEKVRRFSFFQPPKVIISVLIHSLIC